MIWLLSIVFGFQCQFTLASTLSVSPTHFEFEGLSGQSVTEKITIYNSDSVPLRVRLDTGDFWYDRKFERIFPEAGTTRWSAANWIMLKAREMEVPARSQKSIDFVFAVPSPAPESGYAAIFVEQAQPKMTKHGSVGISLRVAVPLLFKVSGRELNRIDIDQLSVKKPTAFQPLIISFWLKNQEEQFIFPEGSLLIVKGEKKEFVAKSDLKRERVLLPKERMKIEIPLGIEPKPGRYEGLLTLYYGRNASAVRNFAFQIP